MTARRALPDTIVVILAAFTSKLSGALTALIGMIVLAGWMFDIAALRSLVPGAAEMKTNTAGALLMAGLSLYLLLINTSVIVRRAARIVAAAVMLLGLATLGEYVLGWQLGIDELVFADSTSTFPDIPGRMSPYSAVALAALGLGVLTMRSRIPAGVAQGAAVVAFVVASTSLLGYMWTAAEFHAEARLPPIPVHAAFSFLLLSTGIYFGVAPLPKLPSRRGRPRVELDRGVVRLFLGGLTVIILFGGLAYHSSVLAAGSADLVFSSYDVRSTLTRIRANVADAATTSFRQELSGVTDPGRMMRPIVDALAQDQEKLGRLVFHDPMARARTDTLRTRVTAYLEALIPPAAESGGLPRNDPARMRARAVAYAAALRPVRTLVDSMMRAEDEILASRVLEARTERDRTLVTLLLTITLAVIGYLVVLRGFVGAMAARTEMEEELRLSNEELESRVEERTSRLERAQRSFADLFESAPDAMLILDADGFVMMGNRCAVEMFGWPHDQLMGQSFERLVPPQPGGLPPGALGREATTRHTPTRIPAAGQKLVAIPRDGAEFQVEISLSPLDTAHGGMVTAAIRDISDRVMLERQLRQSQKMETIGHMAGGIAHDFNNLITIINGTAEIAADSVPQGSPIREDLGTILDAGQRAARVTQQLLAFGRKQILQPGLIDLSRLISDLRPILERLCGESISLDLRLATALPPVLVDPGQIEQVIMNLSVNSRDAMSGVGSLRLETSLVNLDASYARSHDGVSPGPHVMVTVSDTGVGMTRETLGRLFEPFYTTKSSDKGTGLGLSTAYGIVKQSNGDIWAYSEPGKGATFKVYFPVAEGIDAMETPHVEVPHPQSAAGETILVAEDEAGLRNVAVRALEDAGYAVFSAGSMSEALIVASVHGRGIDLLLTDVMMPGGSGRDLADALLATTTGSGMRVLYMSGYTDDAIVHHGVLDASLEFISKPFTRSALLAKVRMVLDG